MKGGVKTTNEAAKLKGKQTKLDVDHDGDIEADDLADLRAGKKAKKVDEAKAKPDFLDMDKDGNKKESMKKAVKDKAMKEAAPSAGLSKEKKSATVKAAKKGEDIGKPGKGFKGLAAKAAKEYGSKEKGEKVAAAAMWKNIKETQAYLAEKKKKEKDVEENLTVVPNPSGAKDAEEAKKLGSMMPAPAGKKDPISESADLTRMRQLTGRLNQNERASLNESGEVASIRALTQKLLG